MSISPKLHNKLQHSKHAAVSLDSLLGVLASAYGTKELDSNTVFDTDSLNWTNISVESFRSQSKIVTVEEATEQNCNDKELGKNSVSTSTTNLKSLRNSESKIDLTLVSIKSLEDININRFEIDLSKTSLNIADDQSKNQFRSRKNKSLENVKSLSSCEMVNVDENCNNLGTTDEQRTTICGFFVDGSDQQVIFDIQFFKKIRNTHFPTFVTNEQDLSIHVTDLVKQTKSVIEISKSCVISKCSYFAEIDKEYGLDNLEVNVKCKLDHFLWIVEWIKSDISVCKPNLCVDNLKGILLISYHLKIYELIEDCLDFFHKNLKSLLEVDCDIEHVLTEDLSLQFMKRVRNSDLNRISDDFESFTAKMFCALIRLLADENVCPNAGHYSSLATMFQCVSCEKLLNHSVMSLVPCSAVHTQLHWTGELQYVHECLPSWNLSKYIELIFEEFQSWKLVYWYLWGMCHFLYCIECRAPYPISQSEWCLYHPNDIEYFPMNSDLYYPIGSYTCCGEKAFKFNVLKQYSGCKFKNHIPDLSSSEDKEMYKIYEANKHFISCKPPEVRPKKFLKLVKKTENNMHCDNTNETFWWDKIQLAPKEKKDYSIISTEIFNRLKGKQSQKKITPKQKPLTFRPLVHFGIMPSAPDIVEDSSDTLERIFSGQYKKNKLTLMDNKSKLTMGPSSRSKLKNKSSNTNHENGESVWSNSLNIKENQENQRDFEEVAMKRLVKMLTSDPAGYTSEPVCGTYVRLESDWWRDHCSDSKISNNANAKSSGTVVNRTFPLSWFRKPPV